MYVGMYVNVCVYVCMYVCECVYVCMYICMYVYVCMYVFQQSGDAHRHHCSAVGPLVWTLVQECTDKLTHSRTHERKAAGEEILTVASRWRLLVEGLAKASSEGESTSVVSADLMSAWRQCRKLGDLHGNRETTHTHRQTHVHKHPHAEARV
jgi:hypothetical protein